MCYSYAELKSLQATKLVEIFKRAVELDAQNGGNGKNPFDQAQLEQEILERLKLKESKPAKNETKNIWV